jgi:hypothetical protein
MVLKKKIKTKYKIIEKYPETPNSKTGEVVDGIAIYPEEIEKVANQMEIPVNYVKDGVLLHEYIHKEYPKLSPKEFSKKFKELYLKLYPDIKKEYLKKILDFSGHFSKADMEIYKKYGEIKVVNPQNPNNPNMEEKLPKFESYDQLENYLSQKSYIMVLDEIYWLEFRTKQKGWKRKDIENEILEWWNEDLRKEPALKEFRRGYFLLWHIKKEIVEGINPSNPENPKKEKNIEKRAKMWAMLDWFEGKIEDEEIDRRAKEYEKSLEELSKELKPNNPSNPENSEPKGISWVEIYDYFDEGMLNLEEFKKKAPKEFYERFKEYWEDYTGEDLEDRIKTKDPLYTTLYTLDALKEEYLEVAEESGVPESYVSYLDAEAMIEDDRMSGYLNYIEFDGNVAQPVKVYYREY